MMSVKFRLVNETVFDVGAIYEALVFHPTLNVILATLENGIVKVIHPETGNVLHTSDLSAKRDGSDRKLQWKYVSELDKILVTDGSRLGCRSSHNGIILLDTILQKVVSQKKEFVRFEMLNTDAITFLNTIQACNLTGYDDLKIMLINSIDDKPTSEADVKTQKWNTVSLKLPLKTLMETSLSLLAATLSDKPANPALPVLSAILEQLSEMCEDEPEFVRLLHTTKMGVEAKRRASYDKWPHKDFKWAFPEQMAKAGFYHEPDKHGDDRALCFTCSVCLVSWELLDEPWAEHERHSPKCPFILGDFTTNVPIAVTNATSIAYNLGKHFKNKTQTKIGNSDFVDLVPVINQAKDEILIFDISSSIQLFHSINIEPFSKFSNCNSFEASYVCLLRNIDLKNKQDAKYAIVVAIFLRYSKQADLVVYNFEKTPNSENSGECGGSGGSVGSGSGIINDVSEKSCDSSFIQMIQLRLKLPKDMTSLCYDVLDILPLKKENQVLVVVKFLMSKNKYGGMLLLYNIEYGDNVKLNEEPKKTYLPLKGTPNKCFLLPKLSCNDNDLAIKFLVLVCEDGSVRIYNLCTFSMCFEIKPKHSNVLSATYCSSTEQLCVSSDDEKLHFYKLRSILEAKNNLLLSDLMGQTKFLDEIKMANDDTVFDLSRLKTLNSYCEYEPLKNLDLDRRAFNAIVSDNWSEAIQTSLQHKQYPILEIMSSMMWKYVADIRKVPKSDSHLFELNLVSATFLSHLDVQLSFSSQVKEEDKNKIEISLLSSKRQTCTSVQNSCEIIEYRVECGPISCENYIDKVNKKICVTLTCPNLVKYRIRTLFVEIKVLKTATVFPIEKVKISLRTPKETCQNDDHHDVPIRSFMIDSNKFLESIIRTVLTKDNETSEQKSLIAFDILLWLLTVRLTKRLENNNAETQKTAPKDQVECFKTVLNFVPDLLKNCLIFGDRSSARKCVQLFLTLDQHCKHLDPALVSSFISKTCQQLEAVLDDVEKFQSSAAFYWFIVLLIKFKNDLPSESVRRKCIKVLVTFAAQLNTKTDPYQAILQTKFDLTQNPFELELFNFIPKLNMKFVPSVPTAKSYAAAVKDFFSSPKTVEHTVKSINLCKDLLFGNKKNINMFVHDFFLSKSCNGLMEVQPLHLNHVFCSDGSRLLKLTDQINTKFVDYKSFDKIPTESTSKEVWKNSSVFCSSPIMEFENCVPAKKLMNADVSRCTKSDEVATTSSFSSMLNTNESDFLKLFSLPVLNAVYIERMNSGTRKYAILDFGCVVKLTDVIVPFYGDLSSLTIDVCLKGDFFDSERILVSTDIAHNYLIANDLQPSPICRYAKVTLIARHGVSSSRCKIALGNFYGKIVTNTEKETSLSPNKLRALKNFYHEVNCKYKLNCWKLKTTLQPLIDGDSEMEVDYCERNIEPNSKSTSKDPKQSKIVSIYNETLDYKYQLNILKNFFTKLHEKDSLSDGDDFEENISCLSSDKMLFLSESILDFLWNFENGRKSFEIDENTCKQLFNGFCLSGNLHMQILMANFLIDSCSNHEFWGTFITNMLCDIFSANNQVKNFSESNVFMLLSYMGSRSINRSRLFDALFLQITKFISPLQMSTQAFCLLSSKIDMLQFEWFLIYVSFQFDFVYSNDNWKWVTKYIHSINWLNYTTMPYEDEAEEEGMANVLTVELEKTLKEQWAIPVSSLIDHMTEAFFKSNSLTSKYSNSNSNSNLNSNEVNENKDQLYAEKQIVNKDDETFDDGTDSSTKFNLGIVKPSFKFNKFCSNETLVFDRNYLNITIKSLITFLKSIDISCRADIIPIVCKVIAQIARCTKSSIHEIFTNQDFYAIFEMFLNSMNHFSNDWIKYSLIILILDLLDISFNSQEKIVPYVKPKHDVCDQYLFNMNAPNAPKVSTTIDERTILANKIITEYKLRQLQDEKSSSLAKSFEKIKQNLKLKFEHKLNIAEWPKEILDMWRTVPRDEKKSETSSSDSESGKSGVERKIANTKIVSESLNKICTTIKSANISYFENFISILSISSSSFAIGPMLTLESCKAILDFFVDNSEHIQIRTWSDAFVLFKNLSTSDVCILELESFFVMLQKLLSKRVMNVKRVVNAQFSKNFYKCLSLLTDQYECVKRSFESFQTNWIKLLNFLVNPDNGPIAAHYGPIDLQIEFFRFIFIQGQFSMSESKNLFFEFVYNTSELLLNQLNFKSTVRCLDVVQMYYNYNEIQEIGAVTNSSSIVCCTKNLLLLAMMAVNSMLHDFTRNASSAFEKQPITIFSFLDQLIDNELIIFNFVTILSQPETRLVNISKSKLSQPSSSNRASMPIEKEVIKFLKSLFQFDLNPNKIVRPIIKFLKGVTKLHYILVLFLEDFFENEDFMNAFLANGGGKILSNAIKTNVRSMSKKPFVWPISSMLMPSHEVAERNEAHNGYQNLLMSTTKKQKQETANVTPSGLLDFSPICTAYCHTSYENQPDILFTDNSSSNQRRGKSPQWNYTFKPSEDFVEICVRLPYAVKIHEIQINANLNNLSLCPSAVVLEASKFGTDEFVPITKTFETTGMTFIYLVFTVPEVVSKLMMRFYRPSHSTHIGLTAIHIMGTTVFQNHLSKTTTLANDENFGWIRLFNNLLYKKMSQTSETLFISGINVNEILEAFCQLLFSPIEISTSDLTKIENSLLVLSFKEDHYGSYLLQLILSGKDASPNSTSKFVVFKVLHDLCQYSASTTKKFDRTEKVLNWLKEIADYAIKNHFVNTANLINYIECISSILWPRNHQVQHELKAYVMSDNLLEKLYDWSTKCAKTNKKLRHAINQVLCSICVCDDTLFRKVLGFLDTRSLIKTEHDISSKHAQCYSQSKQLKSLTNAEIEMLAVVVQSDKNLEIFLNSGLPMLFLQAVSSFCMESPTFTMAKIESVIAILQLFSALCHWKEMQNWLGHHGFGPMKLLLEKLCCKNTPNSYRTLDSDYHAKLEDEYISFLAKVCLLHSDNQSMLARAVYDVIFMSNKQQNEEAMVTSSQLAPTITLKTNSYLTAFIRRIVLQLLLESEKISVFVTVANNTISKTGSVFSNLTAVNHPEFQKSLYTETVKVSVDCTLRDLLAFHVRVGGKDDENAADDAAAAINAETESSADKANRYKELFIETLDSKKQLQSQSQSHLQSQQQQLQPQQLPTTSNNLSENFSELYASKKSTAFETVNDVCNAVGFTISESDLVKQNEKYESSEEDFDPESENDPDDEFIENDDFFEEYLENEVTIFRCKIPSKKPTSSTTSTSASYLLSEMNELSKKEVAAYLNPMLLSTTVAGLANEDYVVRCSALPQFAQLPLDLTIGQVYELASNTTAKQSNICIRLDVSDMKKQSQNEKSTKTPIVLSDAAVSSVATSSKSCDQSASMTTTTTQTAELSASSKASTSKASISASTSRAQNSIAIAPLPISTQTTILRAFSSIGGLALLSQHFSIVNFRHLDRSGASEAAMATMGDSKKLSTGFETASFMNSLTADTALKNTLKKISQQGANVNLNNFESLLSHSWMNSILYGNNKNNSVVTGNEFDTYISKPTIASTSEESSASGAVSTKSVSNTNEFGDNYFEIPSYSLTLFTLCLRLQEYADILLADSKKAYYLLRIVFGLTENENGVEILELPIAESLSFLPFKILCKLLDETPLYLDSSMNLRKRCMTLGIVDYLLGCLSHFINTRPTSASMNTNTNTNTKSARSGVIVKHSVHNTDASSHNASEKNVFWAKGTGFGTGSTQPSWSVKLALINQKNKEKQVAVLLNVFSSFINPGDRLPETKEFEFNPPMPSSFVNIFAQSSIGATLISYLRNDSLMDMFRHILLYLAIFKLLRAFSLNKDFVKKIICSEQDNQQCLILTLLEKMSVYLHKYESKLTKEEKNEKKSKTLSSCVEKEASNCEENLSSLLPIISETIRLVKCGINCLSGKTVIATDKELELDNSARKISISSKTTPEELYVKVMDRLQFGSYEMIVSSEESATGYVFTVPYHYESFVKSVGTQTRPARVKRLAQEAVTLSNSLPLSYNSTVFVRTDADRLDIMKVLIVGPSETPYSNACFEFDVYFPLDYPKVPMLINLETNGYHTVRFNPNLYNDGKVCLSVLNTWHGKPEEKWNSRTSSFLQVLVSIQSLILVSEPYFNEPGYERSRGSSHGKQSSKEYNINIYQASVRWGMLEQLLNPSPCFKEIIETHFYLKKDEIFKQLDDWTNELEQFYYGNKVQASGEAPSSSRSSSKRITMSQIDQFKFVCQEVKSHVEKLKNPISSLIVENENVPSVNEAPNRSPPVTATTYDAQLPSNSSSESNQDSDALQRNQKETESDSTLTVTDSLESTAGSQSQPKNTVVDELSNKSTAMDVDD